VRVQAKALIIFGLLSSGNTDGWLKTERDD